MRGHGPHTEFTSSEASQAIGPRTPFGLARPPTTFLCCLASPALGRPHNDSCSQASRPEPGTALGAKERWGPETQLPTPTANRPWHKQNRCAHGTYDHTTQEIASSLSSKGRCLGKQFRNRWRARQNVGCVSVTSANSRQTIDEGGALHSTYEPAEHCVACCAAAQTHPPPPQPQACGGACPQIASHPNPKPQPPPPIPGPCRRAIVALAGRGRSTQNCQSRGSTCPSRCAAGPSTRSTNTPSQCLSRG